MIKVVEGKNNVTAYSKKWYSVEFIENTQIARLFARNRQGVNVKCVDLLMFNCRLGGDNYFTKYRK